MSRTPHHPPKSKSFDAKFQEGLAAQRAGRLDDAWKHYLKALAISRDGCGLWNNLAKIALDRGCHDAGLAMALRARSCPGAPTAIHPNLKFALIATSRVQDIITLASFDPAAEMIDKKDGIEILRGLGHLEEAVGAYLRAGKPEALTPTEAFQFAQVFLGLGRYAEGFQYLEQRWAIESYASSKRRFENRWKGEDLKGRSIAIFGEMGLGDMIFALRFIPQLRALSPARVIAVASTPLAPLMQATALFDEVIIKNQFDPSKVDHVLYDTDLVAKFLSPSESIDTAPLKNFSAPAQRKLRAQELVSSSKNHAIRIGICWKTDSVSTMNYRKCIAIEELHPLFEVPDVTFFSLVKPKGENQLRGAGLDALVIDAGSTDRDLLDMAALLRELDLVITIDTAVAHLAGSMGIPTWMLTPEPPYWYWNEPGEASSHYPSMRVIRQSKPLQWEEVIVRVVNDLRRFKAQAKYSKPGLSLAPENS